MFNVNKLFQPVLLKNINNKLNKAITNERQKISSGEKYKAPGEANASFIHSEQLKIDINANNQLINNINDSLAFFYTFENAVQETREILNRMNVLLIKASNDTESSETIDLIQTEINGLINALDDNADKLRRFNNKNLLTDKDTNIMYFRYGQKKEEVIKFNLKDLTSNGLGFDEHNLDNADNIEKYLSAVQSNLSDLSIYNNEIAQVSSKLLSNVNFLEDINIDIKRFFSELRDTDIADSMVEKTKLTAHNTLLNNVFGRIINMDRLKTNNLINLLNK